MRRAGPQGRRSGANAQKSNLEGWQLGALIVLFACITALLMVPRSVEPDSGLPLPNITPRELSELRAQEQAEAARLAPIEDRNALLLEARLISFNRAEAEGDKILMSRARVGYEEVVAAMRGQAPSFLRAMRTQHGQRLLRGFAESRQIGEPSEDLLAVGGAGYSSFAAAGWLEYLERDDFDMVLLALHKRRFNALFPQLNESEDALSGVAHRVLLRFLMEAPPKGGPLGVRTEELEAGYVLARIEELAPLEPSYPVLYARGMLLYRLGRFEAAAQSFDRFLLQEPNGRYRLRAINYLKASLEEGSF